MTTDTDRITEIRHLNADGLYGPGRIRGDIGFLLAKVERLRAELDDIHNNPRHPAVAKLQECRRQRDAVQARLDAMETVWGVKLESVPTPIAVDSEVEARDAVASSSIATLAAYQRTPWLEVKDDG